MFTDVIGSTPFVSDDADYLLREKIPYSSFMGDVSLVSTMRAIIAPRMGEGECLNIYTTTFSDAWAGLDALTPSDFKDLSNYFVLFNISNPNSEKRELVFEGVKENFLAENAGYEELEMVEGFFAKSFPVLCFVNREKKMSAVFVQRLDMRKLHYLQTALLVMMPWYHGSRESVNSDELELIKSLKEKTSDRYIELLDKLIGNFDLKGSRVRRLMTGFETRVERNRVRGLEAEIESKNSYIKEYDDYIARMLKEKNELLITLMGLREKIAEMEHTDSDLMGYLLRNKHVTLYDSYDSTVTFITHDYLSFFDEDMVERCLENRRSYVYYDAPDDESGEKMAELLRAVFLDGKLKIRFCAAYQMTAGDSVQTCGGFSFGPDFDTYMPNPHIQRYNCLGNYVRVLNRLIAENDYIGVIDQCIASVKSLNWNDSTVMSCFMRELYNDEYRCVELPDGRVCYPSEAIAWLDEQKTLLSRGDELRAICFEEDEDDEEIEENGEE